MGLISFLKSKFSKKKKEEQVVEDSSSLASPLDEQKENIVEEIKEEKEETKEKVKEEKKTTIEKKIEEKNIKSKEKDIKKEAEIEDKYVAGLDKSREGFSKKLEKLAKSNKVVNDEYFDSIEQILIEADVGVSLTLEIIKETVKQAKAKNITSSDELNDLLIDIMFIGYANKGGTFSTKIDFSSKPTVILLTGVNGSGKTTTVAKLANKFKLSGKKVLLIAGDTFRQGAVEQLTIWASRVGVDIIAKENYDPASLCYDGLKKAVDEKYDVVLVDTAGRLQNKKGLMDELAKIVRVMQKIIPEAPHESLFILDANTGQNGIDQATIFKECIPLTGIVITKMDGTSKGGIILAIRDRLSLPVKFIGLGEKMTDLEEFDLDKYLYGLLLGKQDE